MTSDTATTGRGAKGNSDDVRLRVDGVSKSFRHVDALADVSIEIGTGEVIGLVGENGAGKSTLLKVLTGIHQPDGGRIVLNGEPVEITDPRNAAHRGISIVKQEQDVVPNLTGYENIFLDQIPDFSRFGVVDQGAMREKAQRIVDELGIDLDVSERVSSYSFTEKQMLEIAKAFSQSIDTDHPIILLDEPTAGLEEAGRDLLFDRINDLRDSASFVFVSHELDEVLQVSDRIFVLKDGRLVETFEASEASESALQRAMVGRETASEYYRTDRQVSIDADADVAMEVDGLTTEDRLDDVSFTLHEGEIFGVVGVEGSGKSRLGRVICGADAADAGTVTVRGDEVRPGSLSRMVEAGVGYIPKDRKAEGLLLYQSLTMNVSLPSIGTDRVSDDFGGLGKLLSLIDHDKEESMAARSVEELDIRTPGVETLVYKLSGGNQQKVVLAKWLQRETDTFVMDNVTRGIDVAAKEEVYRVCRDLAEDGFSMVFIGDELPEVIGMSNRIGVMKKGRLVDVIDAPAGDKPTEEEIIQEMI
ncbi:sugar ABC transporter ATP-binding protein [Salinigranum rubrum]|uniref:Sugar ABC transporter ATP-binding protein n=1 Tax=Salinigranum rubrum TaxID=755307 RepID=A0A2I8VEU6_9EURY|nr:sugar ABC transporter ATP-binding protein [Salinigranum rubrum]AUV80448.1 sugar ABC transporter ATP-binding protein [Salinigranum rubrum]